MKNRIFRILAVVTLIAALLTGCTGEQLKDFWQELQGALVGSLVTFDRMEYTRPDPDAFTRMVDDCSKNAQTETDAAALMEQVYAVYEAYYGFYTNYGLADIHYCKDMTDIYWEEEYNYCLSVTSQIDAGLDELLYALAECPLKEELETEEYFGADFFDSYEGESIWDETFTELMNQEAELISRYYELSAESLTMDTYSEAFYNSCGREMADLYVKMIALRQQIDAHKVMRAELANDMLFDREAYDKARQDIRLQIYNDQAAILESDARKLLSEKIGNADGVTALMEEPQKSQEPQQGTVPGHSNHLNLSA